ncbi:MAG: type I CRISPR-associated protein Cas7, partial [Nitrososphaerales archaeon]
MSNPNGDPDENRPRIDPLTKRNLVTDFRLKRTIRDYLSRNLKQTIFIRAEEDKKGNLKRIEDLGEPYIKDDKVDQARLL